MKLRVGQKLSIPLYTLAISNLITDITNGFHLFSIFNIGLIFISATLMLLLKKKFPKIIQSIILLVISIPCNLDPNTYVLNGIFLFLMAFAVYDHKLSIKIVSSIITLVTILFRFNYAVALPSQITGYLSGIAFIVLFFIFYIIKPNITYEINEQLAQKYQINEEIINTMVLYMQGKKWSEIVDILGISITGKSLQRNIKAEYEKLGHKNIAQFSHFLGNLRIITMIAKNQDTQ